MLVAHDSSCEVDSPSPEQIVAQRLKEELECVAQEHTDVSSDEGTGGLGLGVWSSQDHDLHLLHHKRFLDDPPVTLRSQDVAALKRHMRKHEVAKAERRVMGLERAFQLAFEQTMTT